MQDRLGQANKKIRICFVSPKAYPIFNKDIKATFGGAEVDLYYLGTELAKDPDYEVSFVTADYGQDAIEHRENVTIIKSLKFEQNGMTGALKIWRALKKADADMYMIKSISGGLFLLSLFCKLKKKTFLYRTAHTTHCDGTYLRKNPLMGKLFIRSIRSAKAVFTQNESDRQQLLSTTGVASEMIPNGHRILPPSDGQRDSILWVGRSADFKHPHRFLKLARSFENEHFVMICQQATGDREYDRLRDEASQVANLEFIEHVAFGDIAAYFERAKVFVNTSDSEGFPNTFIQACKAATAILSYNVNPDSFLDTYQCGIHCGGDQQRLHDELRKMLESRSFITMGQNGLRYVQEKHDIKKIVQQYKNVFCEMV